jgi:hypothetical protein
MEWMEFDFDPCSGALSGHIPEAAAFANQPIESLICLAARAKFARFVHCVELSVKRR